MSQNEIEKMNSKDFFEFYKSLLLLRSEEELMKYLKDLMTMNELENLVNRFKTAQLLNEGYNYLEIERITGLSSATIAKVSEALKYGYDGYKLVLERNKKRKST